MIFYAIRHKPTGLYLPRREARGATHREPTAALQQARFWHRERDAKGFLTVWLQGKASMREYQDWQGDYDVEYSVDPVPTRKREEMEIVRLELTEVAA